MRKDKTMWKGMEDNWGIKENRVEMNERIFFPIKRELIISEKKGKEEWKILNKNIYHYPYNNTGVA